MEEKARYGWYVKNLIVKFFFIGLLGIIFLMFGLIIRESMGLILIAISAFILFFFMWPAIGMSILNIQIGDDFFLGNRLKEFSTNKQLKILDIGCGTGRTAIKIAKALKDNAVIYGIDIFDENAISGNKLNTIQKNATIENVHHNTIFQYGSATKIPFEDGTFDIITVFSVLHEIHNVEDQIKAIQEIYRVLKPEGYLYLSEWNRYSWQTIGYFGIFCFVFKTQKYWNNLLELNQIKEAKYENDRGFGFFIAKK